MTPSDASDESTRTLARGGVLSVAGTVVSAIAGFLTTAFITRGIDIDVAGALLSAIALYSMAMQIGMFGANTGIVRFLAQADVSTSRDHPLARPVTRAAITPIVVTSVLTALLAMVFADQIAGVLASPDEVVGAYADFIRNFAWFLPASTVAGVLLSATRGYRSMLPTTGLDLILLPVGQALLVGAVIGLGGTARTVSMVYWAPAAAVVLLAWRSLERRLPRRGTAQLAAPWTEFWTFSLPRAAARIFSFLLARLDVLMIGALASTREAGIYAAAIRFVGLALALQWALGQPFEPEIARLLANRDSRQSQRQFNVITGWSVLVTWPVLLTLIVHGSELLRLSFGPEYSEGAPALLIVAAAIMVATGVGSIDTVLVMSGRSGWSLVNTGVALAVNVAMNVVLIPRMGMEGAAIAWATAIVLYSVAPLVQVRLWVGLLPFGASWVRATALTLASFGFVGWVARSLAGAGWPGLVAGLTASGLAYLSLLYLAREVLQIPALVDAVRPGGGRAVTDDPDA